MGEIKVGEYVRTESGNIGKFYRPASENSDVYYKYINKDGTKITSRYDSIVKHSPNIIDLIQVGDYVNGIEVMGIYIPRDVWEPIQINVDSQTIKYFLVDDIKSIVTKEQFNNIKYEVN